MKDNQRIADNRRGSTVCRTVCAALRKLHGAVDPCAEFIYPERIEEMAAFIGWEPAILLRAQIESMREATDEAKLEFWDSFGRWFGRSKNSHIAALFARAAEQSPVIDDLPGSMNTGALR